MHEVNPQVALLGRWPILPVTIGVHDAVASEMRERGMEIPPPAAGHALLDAGASVTCIDDAAEDAHRTLISLHGPKLKTCKLLQKRFGYGSIITSLPPPLPLQRKYGGGEHGHLPVEAT